MFQELAQVAGQLLAPGKGILAADESGGTIGKRLQAVGVESTEAVRREYRELLFTAPDIEKYINGVILFDETIRQKTADGTPFPEFLAARGILPGIKVDKGTVDLPLFHGEKFTQGLDGLGERLDEYRALGARFAKWRAVIAIGAGLPTLRCLRANAEGLALYAALCQQHGLVPIVEPEVLIDGDYDIETGFRVTEAAQHEVFDRLARCRVSLEHMVLKPNMVLPGKDSPKPAGPEEVADMTLTCLKRTVPAAVPGIAFLSGGQSDAAATANLNAINLGAKGMNVPWRLTFSYSRALQASPMSVWGGRAENKAAAQRAFIERARLNAAASAGKCGPG
jgi:fructose-bisphosphate aldolase class I